MRKNKVDCQVNPTKGNTVSNFRREKHHTKKACERYTKSQKDAKSNFCFCVEHTRQISQLLSLEGKTGGRFSVYI